MRLISQQVPMNFNLFLFSCTHWGSTFTHESGWSQLVEMINSPYAGLPASANYGVHHGDMIEGREINHPFWSLAGNMKGGVIRQFDESKRRMKPIAKHLITMLQGNHELGLMNRIGDVTAWVAKEIGVLYGTYSAKISFISKRDGSLLFKHFATHGRKSITSTADDVVRRESNMQLALKRHMKFKAGDCYLMSKGHTHRLFVAEPKPELYLNDDLLRVHQGYTWTPPNAPFIDPGLRWYANVGAFYRMYGSDVVNYDFEKPDEGAQSSYVETGEYDPAELGFAVVIVRDGSIQKINTVVVD